MNKTVSIYLDEKTWREFKLRCVEKNTTLTARLADLIMQSLRRDGDSHYPWPHAKNPHFVKVKGGK